MKLDRIIEATVAVRRQLRLGDQVERLAAATGAKQLIERVHGGPCRGCERRKALLNGEPPPPA